MKNKRLLRITTFVCSMMFLLCVCGCQNKAQESTEEDTEQGVWETPDSRTELSFDQRSLFLTKGDSVSLSLEQDVDSVTYMSSRPDVAEVTEDGTVTALKKGNALITATAGDSTAYCGVLVDLSGDLIDVAGMDISTYVDKATLTMPSIHQSFAVDPVNGDVYFLQKYDDTPSDLVANRLLEDGTLEWMRLIDFGHGSSIAVEHQEDGSVYIWVSSDADINESCATVSRILWEPEKVYQEHGGTVFAFPGAENTPLPSLDQENGLLCIRTRSGGQQDFRFYDLESILAGEELVPLAIFSFYSGSSESEPGYYSFQGYVTSGRYIYVLEGDPDMQPQIVTWDIEGEMLSIVPLSQDHTAAEWNGYYEPEGLNISNGILYYGVASNPSGNRRSSIFSFGGR